MAWPVPPDALEAALGGLRALGCAGANVTMPHKETALAHLDELSPDAHATGAVNTIECRPGRLVGHNTDVYGLVEFLTADAGVIVTGTRALVLGAGGASRAVVTALERLGAAGIEIAARNADAAAAVAALCREGLCVPLEWENATKAAAGADIVVNATPLVEAARAQGAEAWGGVGMLVHQAAGALRIWTGLKPPLEVMSAAAVRAIGRRAPTR